MKYLAVGVCDDDELAVWSQPTDCDDPQEVACMLSDQWRPLPTQILLLENGPDGCPVVVKHWNAGDDYILEE